MMVLLATFIVHPKTGWSMSEGEEPNRDDVSSFVIVGAFSLKMNATRYADHLDNDFNANYAVNPDKNLFYVYILRVSDPEQARQYSLNLRDTDNRFPDAWVFDGILNTSGTDPVLVQAAYEEEKQIENTIKSVEPIANLSTETAEEPPVEKKPSTPKIELKQGEYLLFVNTINATNFKEIEGQVEVIDNTRQHLLKEINSQQLVKIKAPHSQDQSVKIISKMFGYRYADFAFSLKNPVTDSTSQALDIIGDSIVVDMPLTRMTKGDFQVLWNVYFYIDAAVMRAESISELNSIVSMLNENPNMKIRIHGHTNGNSHGKIILMEQGSSDFFNLTDDNKTTKGSAKKLSEERAKTIKNFLVFNGIEESRLEVKGWGGKKMLYDKHAASAKKNVRVEVEVISD